MAITLDDPFLFAMYSVEAFLDLELLVFFLLRWRPQKTRHVAVLGLAYLCFGIARILLMFWDYTEPKHDVANAGFYITAAFFAFMAMAVFMHAAEILIKKTRHAFTVGFLGLSCAILFFPLGMYETVQMIYYIFAPVLIMFVIGFLFYLMSMTTGSVRKKFFVVFIGLALYGTGYALSARIFNVSKIVSESIVLAGLACTALGFIEIPMLEEIHWNDYLLHVFAFHIDSSACIHDETLAKVGLEENVSADLFSSGVTGVIGIIKEMIQSEKKLKVLDHEDKKILLEYGKHVTVALITRKDLDILHEKLRTYIRRVETELRQPLENWRGEVGRFAAPMKTITTDVLKTVIDRNWWRVDPRSVARQVVAFMNGLFPKNRFGHHPEKKMKTYSKTGVQPTPKKGSSSVPSESDPWLAPDSDKKRASTTPAPATAPPATATARSPIPPAVTIKPAAAPALEANAVPLNPEAQTIATPARQEVANDRNELPVTSGASSGGAEEQVQVEQLDKLKTLFKISERVKIDDIATMLSTNRKDVFDKLLTLSKSVDFQINEDLVIIEEDKSDLLITELDKQFTKWGNKEQSKSGKIKGTSKNDVGSSEALVGNSSAITKREKPIKPAAKPTAARKKK
jgi:hypothetical protein